MTDGAGDELPPPAYPGGPPQPGQAYPGQPYPGQPNPGQPPYGQAYGQAYPGQPPYGAPGYGPPPKQSQATLAMVLGIISVAGPTVGACLYLPVLGAFLGPVAWILGQKSINEIDRSPVPLGGRGEANAGRILGIIGTVLLVLGIIAVIGLITVLASTDWSEF